MRTAVDHVLGALPGDAPQRRVAHARPIGELREKAPLRHAKALRVTVVRGVPVGARVAVRVNTLARGECLGIVRRRGRIREGLVV